MAQVDLVLQAAEKGQGDNMRQHPCYSSISTYIACPAAFRLGYRDGEPPLVRTNLLNGQLLHDGIAAYASHCWRRKLASDFEAGRSIAAAYSEPTRGLLETFVENTRWEWGDVVIKDTAPVEQHLSATLPGGMLFSGHVDLIQRYLDSASAFGEDDSGGGDGSLWVVTDWKSSFYGDTDTDEAPLQLRAYAWLVQQNWPEARELRVQLQSIRTGHTRWWALGGDLGWIGEELQAIVDRIARDEHMEPRPGPDSCPQCLYAAACPLRGTKTLEVLTEQPLETTAAAYYWHKAQADLARGLLKARAEADGGLLQLGDQGAWGWTERTSLVPRDQVALRDVCTLAGHDWTELLGGYDKRKVQRAVRDGWLPEDLFEERVAGRVFGPLKDERGDE